MFNVEYKEPLIMLGSLLNIERVTDTTVQLCYLGPELNHESFELVNINLFFI